MKKCARDYLLYYSDNLPIELNEIGQWWGTDPGGRESRYRLILSERLLRGNEYIIGSCKYRNEKTGVDELERMRHYAVCVWKGDHYHYYIFSKGGFTEGLLQAQERGEVRLIALEDLYR